MFWEILLVSEVSEFLYRRMMSYFSKGTLRINRLCLLEAPESRCWDRVRSRRRLLGDCPSQGSRGRRWAWAGWVSDRVQVGLSPCALWAPHCTVTAGAACREGPEASQKVPAAGESAPCIFCRWTASSFLKGDLSSALCQWQRDQHIWGSCDFPGSRNS